MNTILNRERGRECTVCCWRIWRTLWRMRTATTCGRRSDAPPTSTRRRSAPTTSTRRTWSRDWRARPSRKVIYVYHSSLPASSSSSSSFSLIALLPSFIFLQFFSLFSIIIPSYIQAQVRPIKGQVRLIKCRPCVRISAMPKSFSCKNNNNNKSTWWLINHN